MTSQTKKLIAVGVRQFIIAVMVLFGFLIGPSLVLGVLRVVNPEMAYGLLLIGPYSVGSWAALLMMALWYPLALGVWVFRDASRFYNEGIRTSPLAWAIGSFLPTALVVIPVYYIVREVVWARRIHDKIVFDGTQSAWLRKKFFGFPVRELTLSALAIGFVVYVVVVALDIPGRISKPATDAEVAKIHATKLTMDDVMGTNLPSDPGAAADTTIAGVDANHNGIRDDVELAIFKAYPNSAKMRLPLLQYALAMQLEMTLPILNKDTVTAAVEDTESRANVCLWTLSSRSDLTKFLADMRKYDNFVKNLQINTQERDQYLTNFYEYIGSYSSSNDGCDIDPATLPN
ncbi:MAG: hypothetical protein KGJ13_11965 [Patescibacteria group bacterium]|nr:hypothetical protein [Patescibacteria group bacterium]MDE2021044.1 hypothetical protein [Patescibacteria group bacterium]